MLSVNKFPADIGMEFELEKYAMIVIKAVVKVKSEGIGLPSGGVIKEVEKGG